MADTHTERERARAYADMVQFRIGKGLESREYLEYLHMFLQDYCQAIRTSLAQGKK